MKPLVCNYLVTHSLANLEEEHGVKARWNASGDKFSLNYNQIKIKNGDLLAEQCRGLILRPGNANVASNSDKIGETIVLAWPMNRFYNYGDPAAHDVNWKDPDLHVYEKLDGTMIIVYWDAKHKRWYAATRSVPEADLPIQVGDMVMENMTFYDLFMNALVATCENVTGNKFDCALNDPGDVIDLNKDMTYVFELTTPMNRIIVKYDEPRVTLLASRNVYSGDEIMLSDIHITGVRYPQVWNIASPTALDAFVNSADPVDLEGAVVIDSMFRRVKVKNKAWVLSSRAKDLVTVSKRTALRAIINGEIDDIIPMVEDDIASQLNELRAALIKYDEHVHDVFIDWAEQAGDDRKTFAGFVNASDEWATPFFQIYNKKGDGLIDWLQNEEKRGRLHSTTLESLLERIS